MPRYNFGFVLLLTLAALANHTNAGISSVSLNLLSTTYLPSSVNATGQAMFRLGADVAESIAYDATSYLVYAIGDPGYLSVVAFNSTTGLGYVSGSILVSDTRATSVDVCGDLVAVSVWGSNVARNGYVEFYNRYDPKSMSFQQLRRQSVGYTPIEVKFTTDCETLVVVNRGDAGWTNDTDFTSFVNPEGSVTVISSIVRSGQTLTYTVKTANFTNFNDQVSALQQQGLHFVMQEDSRNNTYTLAQDIEPESLTFSSDRSIAYVCLQENNAVAILDLASATVTAIYGMGFKDFSLDTNAIDSNDNDKIEITKKPRGFYGLYQPDGVGTFSVEGNRYVVTANEGDSREYQLHDQVLFSEEVEGDFFVGKLTPSANSSLYASIVDGGDLNGLRMSSAIGRNENGLYEAIYAFGGRSFSVYRQDANQLTQVYDSGKVLAEEHVSRYRTWFNGQVSPSKTVSQSFDSRSDRKGIETEAVHVATVGGDRILFLSNERTSTLFVFQMENPSSPELLATATNINTQLTGQEAYDARTLGDADPEGLVYVPPSSSPVTGKAVLIVAGSYSGTVSLYEVEYTCSAGEIGENCIMSPSAASTFHGAIGVTTVLLVVITCCFSLF